VNPNRRVRSRWRPSDEGRLLVHEVLAMGRADPVSLLSHGAVMLLVQEMVTTSKLSGCTIGDVQEALVVELETGRRRLHVWPEQGPD